MEIKNEKESGLIESLEAVGQMVLGGVEAIGGILTADPVTRAEGDFNRGAGAAHQEANLVGEAIKDKDETANVDEPNSGKGNRL